MQTPIGTILATGLAILAALIVYTTLAGTPLPLLASDRSAFIALAVAGFAMCVAGGVGREPTEFRATLPTMIASVSGALALFTIIAVVAGWTAVFDPLAQVVYGAPAATVLDRVGIIALAVFIGVAWAVSTLRQVGSFGLAATT